MESDITLTQFIALINKDTAETIEQKWLITRKLANFINSEWIIGNMRTDWDGDQALSSRRADFRKPMRQSKVIKDRPVIFCQLLKFVCTRQKEIHIAFLHQTT